MLNPAAIRDAIVAQIRLIPSVVALMGGDPARISAHTFIYGNDGPLMKAVYEMTPPAILIAWKGQIVGPADGNQLAKHQFDVFMRLGNQASEASPASYEDLWHAVTNELPAGSPVNLRYVNLLPELEIMDTPYSQIVQDDQGIDFLRSVFTFPELGDN